MAPAEKLEHRVLGRGGLSVAAIGLGCTWLGILLAYDSYHWPPVDHGWPASFFVVTLVLISYLLSDRLARRRSRA